MNKPTRTSRKASPTKKTANAPAPVDVALAYAGKLEACRSLLAQLEGAVKTHSPLAATWGHVGDLTEVERQLRDALQFLTGTAP